MNKCLKQSINIQSTALKSPWISKSAVFTLNQALAGQQTNDPNVLKHFSHLLHCKSTESKPGPSSTLCVLVCCWTLFLRGRPSTTAVFPTPNYYFTAAQEDTQQFCHPNLTKYQLPEPSCSYFHPHVT